MPRCCCPNIRLQDVAKSRLETFLDPPTPLRRNSSFHGANNCILPRKPRTSDFAGHATLPVVLNIIEPNPRQGFSLSTYGTLCRAKEQYGKPGRVDVNIGRLLQRVFPLPDYRRTVVFDKRHVLGNGRPIAISGRLVMIRRPCDAHTTPIPQ
ncbi:hypothetical protein CC78DRAFT_248795 [Lojkania enalia]|uniref:Uncharacterized protein n=1 Tax=Lojkania enalia TaxID=147567 RepID=A0A9P4KAD6_9PLEO|nr:hypothetical protein CC78DRAFT_248795 [Didymosphaeria enalia]